jgi:sarcosine oxidase
VTAAEVAVVGAGVVGLATADALLQRGASVVVFERGMPGNAQSGGESRIFRHIHADRRLAAFALAGRGLWREWEQRFGRELLSGVGVVSLGAAAEQQLAVLRDVGGGIRARLIDGQEVHERIPLLAPWQGPALLDEDGGVIRTRATIEALTEVVGDRIVYDEVLAVRCTSSGGVEVRSGGAAREYDRVVVCAGRGSAALASSAGLTLPVQQAAHARLTYRVRGEPRAVLGCLLDGSGTFGEPMAYADPLPGDREYAVGLYHAPVDGDGAVVDPDALSVAAQRTSAYVARALPGLEPVPIDVRHCLLTELPWSEDGIGVWQQAGLAVVAGNNMFKHAPALGRALARAALDQGLDPHLHPEAGLGAVEGSAAASDMGTS